ncbi:MAG: uridine kinase [Longimicrobiales bacterium]|nr:uridine kinase [Longimicrobiales bacterium]
MISDPPIVVGIAGGSGSGKTTVVRAIREGIAPARVALLHHDAYYRSFDHLDEAERAEINFDHPDALETSLLVEHIDTLRSGVPIEMPVYDFRSHTRTSRTVPIDPARVLLIDGILILAEPELRARMDIRIFVDTDPDVRLIRRLRRDLVERGRTLESVLEQYERTVRPMHLEFVESSRRYADLIIPEGGHNPVAIEMLVTRLSAVLPDA